MNMTLHLKICGILMIGLAALHPLFALRFRWREELADVSLFTRQVFWVHSLFIVLVLLLFGLLSLAFSEALLERTMLARAVLAGFVTFWSLRWVAQHFIYSPALWRGHRLNTIMHVMFTALWTYLVVVYGTALWRGIIAP
jgi:hypothetical protein